MTVQWLFTLFSNLLVTEGEIRTHGTTQSCTQGWIFHLPNGCFSQTAKDMESHYSSVKAHRTLHGFIWLLFALLELRDLTLFLLVPGEREGIFMPSFLLVPYISLLFLHTCVLVTFFYLIRLAIYVNRPWMGLSVYSYTQRETVWVQISTRVGNWNSIKGLYI